MCDNSFEGDDWFPCPAKCGARFCCLECIWDHRQCARGKARSCPRKSWRVPKFGERFSGPRAPLTHAVAQLGGVEVQKPFDILTGSDMFTEEGRNELQTLTDDPMLYCEHWAPECKLFSRARGRPIVLRGGERVPGPQPVRDANHVMGFPWLQGDMKARLRRSNNMALRALKRMKHIATQRQPRHGTTEHPKNSWMWEFTLVKQLEDMGLTHAIGSSCCFGGDREKFYSFFGTSEEIHAELDRE